ncbi:PfkB family carbohydrate kinase [Pseudomonas typographi]|uniref:PfkB family carbohydrate kinase n=1 Tax=Pseudomonas typographi TaxID=2715964 RepID=UPI0016838F67|nr:PfkB family carbohydrate kinase [Pseudomonas typographi]MBD1554655.1 ribokinase [Pseudomonas typographi]
MPSTLLSLGSINADFQVRVAQPPGSQETLLASDFCRLSGGKAANRAYLATLFGHHSVLLGRVGADELADQALGNLRQAGVLLDGVTHAPGHSTAVSMITVPASGKKQIILANNANDAWDGMACDRVRAAIAAAPPQAVLALDHEIPAAVVRMAIEAAQQRSLPVVLDPSFPERLEPGLWPLISAVTPNTEEAAHLLGQPVTDSPSAARAAAAFRQRGVPMACVKLADGGCLLACAEGVYHVPAGGLAARDATGAGDAFTGVFAIALLEGQPASEAALWATAAAHLAVAGYGSQPAYAGREQVLAMAEQLRPQLRRVDD